jgi:hypothetical protein
MFRWSEFDDENLLQLRICDLGLRFEETDLASARDQLYRELNSKNILFQPHCYLADEWFVPSDGTAIGIPFFLAHPRLKKLEKKMIRDVEGGERDECMKLIRHEAGHSIFNAFKLQRKRKIAQVFGPSSDETPEVYHPKPYSRSFVHNLDNWYAQCDADEDFAETFAVWLNPESNWQEHYKGWKAIKKLRLMDEIMKGISGKKAFFISNEKPCAAGRLKSRLSTFYQRKRKKFEEELPNFFDVSLRKVFSADEMYQDNMSASRFLKNNEKKIVDKVSQWTRAKKYSVYGLLSAFVKRCQQTSLRLKSSEEESYMDICMLVATLINNYHHTGKLKGRL